jgi:hypothetical protein
MAKHNVYVNLPWRELGKVDAQFNIYQDEKKLGTITISKGSVEWYPKNSKKPYKIGWSHFDKMIKEYCED